MILKLCKNKFNKFNNLNNMERLVVMDYSDSSVTVYTNPKDEDTDTLLRELGHNPDECSCMFCENVSINLK